MADDLFSERVVEAAGRSGCSVAPHLVPSTTSAIGTADWRWFGLCADLLALALRANTALDTACVGVHVDVESDPDRRQLTLHCGERWLRLRREQLLGRGHIAVERSYRLVGYPPEPGDTAALEDLLFELIAAGGEPALA